MADALHWAAVNARLAAIGVNNPAALSDVMAALYEAIASLGEPLLQEFEAFGEDLLADRDGVRAASVAAGYVHVALGGDERAMLLDAARLLRAIEANALEFSHYLESDLDDDLEALWRTTDGRHYVVPRVTALAPIDGKPFRRRALRHFRVIPTRIGGFAVRLHRSTAVADARRREEERIATARTYGAALFPGLTVHLAYPDADSFTVERLSGFDPEAVVADQLRAGREADCHAIVWGELTMPEASVAFLRKSLARHAIEAAPSLRYLIAGSWHRTLDGSMRNVAVVLDGYGEPLFDVLKWAKFKIGARREAIVPGDEAHVLVGEGELMVVAICRDFLQSTTDVPYRDLNVDIAIVPSMIASLGDKATLRGHAATADVMRVRYGTRTLAVAQPAQPDAGGVGQVLAFPARPAISDGERVDGPWHLCRLESP